MPTRPIATRLIKKLVDHGFIAYFAGGWVRDHLMQHPSDDIDIATTASVEEIQKLFEETTHALGTCHTHCNEWKERTS